MILGGRRDASAIRICSTINGWKLGRFSIYIFAYILYYFFILKLRAYINSNVRREGEKKTWPQGNQINKSNKYVFEVRDGPKPKMQNQNDKNYV